MDLLSFNDLQSASIKNLFETRLQQAREVLKVDYVTNKELPDDIDTIVILVRQGQDICSIKHLPFQEDAASIDAFLQSEKFTGKKNATSILPLRHGDKYIRYLIFSVGDKKDISPENFEIVGRRIYNVLHSKNSKKVALFFDGDFTSEIAYRVPFGMSLNRFRFDLKTKKEDDKLEYVGIEKLFVFLPEDVLPTSEVHELSKRYKLEMESLTRAINITRTYCDGPPNLIYPKSLADYIKKDLKDFPGMSVDILDKNQMQAEGMGALLGVGQASINEPRLVVLKYTGNSSKKDESPLLFVGKGVTFDSGGLSIKPADSMMTMKYDMSGAATVAGLIRTLAERKAKINVVGVLGIVENSISHNAQRPDDVVMSMSGQTIEVLNTDAEGRLVLADALTYGQRKFKPKLIIDLATLTGAIVVALGTNTMAGLMSNNDEISAQLIESGKRSNERVWRLPMSEEFNKKMDSKIADMQNIGNTKGFGASSITAAEFLHRFIENNTPWAHLDIAGVDNRSSASDTELFGSAAFGIRLLNDFVRQYEVK